MKFIPTQNLKIYTKEEAAIEMLKSPGKCFTDRQATHKSDGLTFWNWDPRVLEWRRCERCFEFWNLSSGGFMEAPDPSKPEEKRESPHMKAIEDFAFRIFSQLEPSQFESKKTEARKDCVRAFTSCFYEVIAEVLVQLEKEGWRKP